MEKFKYFENYNYIYLLYNNKYIIIIIYTYIYFENYNYYKYFIMYLLIQTLEKKYIVLNIIKKLNSHDDLSL